MKQRRTCPRGLFCSRAPTSLRRSATGWRWSTAWHRHNQQPWRQQRCSGPWQGTSSRASVSQGLVAIWAVPASHGRKGRGSLGRRCQSRGCRGSRTRGNPRAPGTPTSTWGASRTQGLQPGPPKRKRLRALGPPWGPARGIEAARARPAPLRKQRRREKRGGRTSKIPRL